MVHVSDDFIRYEGASYKVTIDYMQREKQFRLTLPPDLAKFFNVTHLYGKTEDEALKNGEDMLKSFVESKQSPIEKVIAYNFRAGLMISNPENHYVISKIGDWDASPPSIAFDFEVGYRQDIPDPSDLNKIKIIFFRYNKTNPDQRESWSTGTRYGATIIPWSQGVEDFFTSFKTALENMILNIFTFLDKPYPHLKQSIEALGSGKLPELTGPLESQWFPSHQEGRCEKCGEETYIYTNLKGDREKRCRTCGMVAPFHKDDIIAERLKGIKLLGNQKKAVE